ncbi:pre-mRNA 3'-end-processing factor FIP1 isoform X1 [Lates calcarifer]|uniref:Pre-mRNA 3'-end-processing factor FIP1 isoform X1 n=1 Tax=Lates calcarifer TaxID=8187 RepID=A0A4W6CGN5_LATCA|nr:pre-mRNA 3'-end-processing factor FIP1 isoform X1 [Lates calcarifer]
MFSESASQVVAEDEDEEDIYQFIFDMCSTDSREREEEENAQIPSSPEHTPVHLKINGEKKTHVVVGATNRKDMDALDNMQGIPVLHVNVASEEKPWRIAGTDISDYFNYGFNEGSWNAYCKKQSKLRAANRKLYNKTRVQKGHTKLGKKDPCHHSSSGSPLLLASRESSARPGPGSSSRVEGYCCLSDEGNSAQVVTEMFPMEDRITSYPLIPSPNFMSRFAYTTPPSSLYRPEPPSLSTAIATLDSGHAKEFDDPSTSYTCSSGVSSLITGSMASSSRVINAAKAWELCIWQEKCDKDRDRSREHGHDKNSRRGRIRESESCSFSHSSGEERMRHRDTMERGHKRHHFEKVSGEEEEHTEKRQKSEGWQKSLRSSSSSSSSRGRRDDGEDRESQSRHKQKKAKRNRKDK